MNSQSMNRKDFLKLTFTLVGGAAVVAGCSSSSASGTGGSSGSGGAAGHPADASSSSGGSGDAKVDTASVDTGKMCADPLVTGQIANSTSAGPDHLHTLFVPASTLTATTDQTWITSGYPPGSGGHFHTVALKVADLATLKGGGSVTVTSSLDGDPFHSHMFMVSCTGD